MFPEFTLKSYNVLLKVMLQYGYKFQSFEQFLQNPFKRVVVLRHDVDKKPDNSLNIAGIESELGIKSTYYFRIVKKSYNVEIIKRIIELGHEIGYHYEDVALAKGDIAKAKKLFEEHLLLMRGLYPVKSICMHGSPLSRYDNRQIWNQINYKDYDVIGEPYFDVDYNKVLYLTDTGRKWNNTDSAVRDKVETKLDYSFKNTEAIINSIKNDKFPDQVMMNIHPQRWTNNFFLWIHELLYQSLKNQIKKRLYVR